MRVYLDNCCYNRPFDGQGDFRVAIETRTLVNRDAFDLGGHGPAPRTILQDGAAVLDEPPEQL